MSDQEMFEVGKAAAISKIVIEMHDETVKYLVANDKDPVNMVPLFFILFNYELKINEIKAKQYKGELNEN